MTTKKQIWVLVMAAVAVVLIYAAFIHLMLFPDGESANTGVFEFLLYSGLGLLLVLAIVAIVLHNISARCNPVRERQAMLIIKLGLVPFYLIGGFIIFVMMVVPVPGLLFGGLSLAVVGWLIMMLGSVWAICYALSMRKAGMISGGLSALFIVMQFFFVLDVLAAVIMFFLGRSREKQRGV